MTVHTDEWNAVHLQRGCAGRGLPLDSYSSTLAPDPERADAERLTLDTTRLVYWQFPESFTVHVFAFRTVDNATLRSPGGAMADALRSSVRLPGPRLEPRPASWTFTVFEEGTLSDGDLIKRVDIRQVSCN